MTKYHHLRLVTTSHYSYHRFFFNTSRFFYSPTPEEKKKTLCQAPPPSLIQIFFRIRPRKQRNGGESDRIRSRAPSEIWSDVKGHWDLPMASTEVLEDPPGETQQSRPWPTPTFAGAKFPYERKIMSFHDQTINADFFCSGRKITPN